MSVLINPQIELVVRRCAQCREYYALEAGSACDRCPCIYRNSANRFSELFDTRSDSVDRLERQLAAQKGVSSRLRKQLEAVLNDD